MYLRIDKIGVDFPEPKGPSPDSAAALQELLGGKFGEMSTLMNYTFQSLNYRGKSKARPYYDLIPTLLLRNSATLKPSPMRSTSC